MFEDEDRKGRKASEGRGKKTTPKSKTVTLEDDEMIVKKKDWEELQRKCDVLEIEIEQIKEEGGGGDNEGKNKRNIDTLKSKMKQFRKCWMLPEREKIWKRSLKRSWKGRMMMVQGRELAGLILQILSWTDSLKLGEWKGNL